MSEVVYARIPEALKQALGAHASARGVSLTAALVELLEQGLEASAEERSAAGLERELALARIELAETGGRLRETELRLEAAREREELSARTYRALAERARQELASCPRCREPVRGSDLLVSGHCPRCGKALSSLLTPVARAGGLEPSEYLALLGALGAVVGFALAGTAENAG
jgi:rubrerythrin